MLDLVANAITALHAVLSGDIEIGPEREIKVEGTGGIAVEILTGIPWSQPTYNTARNDVLKVNVHADCSRNAFNEPVKADADQRAYIVWETVDRLLHDQDHALGWVASSYRHSGPALTLIPNGDGAVLLTAEYEVRH